MEVKKGVIFLKPGFAARSEEFIPFRESLKLVNLLEIVFS